MKKYKVEIEYNANSKEWTNFFLYTDSFKELFDIFKKNVGIFPERIARTNLNNEFDYYIECIAILGQLTNNNKSTFKVNLLCNVFNGSDLVTKDYIDTRLFNDCLWIYSNITKVRLDGDGQVKDYE